jgi:hypothetical protein
MRHVSTPRLERFASQAGRKSGRKFQTFSLTRASDTYGPALSNSLKSANW